MSDQFLGALCGVSLALSILGWIGLAAIDAFNHVDLAPPWDRQLLKPDIESETR